MLRKTEHVCVVLAGVWIDLLSLSVFNHTVCTEILGNVEKILF